MKKALLMLFAMAVSFSAFAQYEEFEKNTYVTKKNHISVGYNDYMIESLIGSTYIGREFSLWGGVNLTYTRNLAKWFELGGVVAVGGQSGCVIACAMPVAQFNYYRNSWFKISGEAALGVLFGTGDTLFAFQANPAVLRFGSDKIAGFAKFGIGYLGVFAVGVQVGF